jgi:hypothetical protein
MQKITTPPPFAEKIVPPFWAGVDAIGESDISKLQNADILILR